MNVLITAGPTREPIDAVRFISNRSSGQMGLALIQAASAAGHSVTAILGPVSFDLPGQTCRIDVETTREMHEAVMREWPRHDLLIMAAAVADYRPKQLAAGKLARTGTLTLELEPTEDIVATAAAVRRPDQRIIGFSLESAGQIDRAREKLRRKNLDMVVYNPLPTMNSAEVEAVLVDRDGHEQALSRTSKQDFARTLIKRATALFV